MATQPSSESQPSLEVSTRWHPIFPSCDCATRILLQSQFVSLASNRPTDPGLCNSVPQWNVGLLHPRRLVLKNQCSIPITVVDVQSINCSMQNTNRPIKMLVGRLRYLEWHVSSCVSAGIWRVCGYCVRHGRKDHVRLRFSALSSMEMGTVKLTRTRPRFLQLVQNNLWTAGLQWIAENTFPLLAMRIFSVILIWCL
jgi:hypothetical protein